MRVFAGRTSTGVRGIKLADGDEVVSLSILAHVDATPEERAAFFKMKRDEGLEMEGEAAPEADEVPTDSVTLSQERYEELKQKEQYILTVSDRGYGKRSSSYEYRTAGRGGQGIWNMEMGERNGSIVAAFPVESNHQVMMVTNGGQVIRMPLHDVRVAGRKTLGVTLFRVGADERVVSVATIAEEEGENGVGENGIGETGVEDGGDANGSVGSVGDAGGTAGPNE